jgi:hypothetical protein
MKKGNKRSGNIMPFLDTSDMKDEVMWCWLLSNSECNRVLFITEKETSISLDPVSIATTAVAIESKVETEDFIPKTSWSQDNISNKERLIHFEGNIWRISRLEDGETADRNTSMTSRQYSVALLKDGSDDIGLAGRVVKISILNSSWDMANLPPIPHFKKQVNKVKITIIDDDDIMYMYICIIYR